MMGCLSCSQLKDKAYVNHIKNKLVRHFESNPCSKCGETDIRVLTFSSGTMIWDMIAETTPWVRINSQIQQVDVLCANCWRLLIAEKVGLWGLPNFE